MNKPSDHDEPSVRKAGERDTAEGPDRHHEHSAEPEAQKAHSSHREKQADDHYIEHVNNKGMTEKLAGSGSMASDDATGSSRDQTNRQEDER